jgi:hypothetical protein
LIISRAQLTRAGAAFAVCGLAACAGGSSVPTPAGGGASAQSQQRASIFSLSTTTGSSWIDPTYAAGIADGSKAVVYVADYASGIINIYPASGKAKKPIGQITGVKGPQGIAVDTSRNLYVTENTNGDVLVYPAGKTKNPDVLQDAGHSPESVSVADDGTVYVANHDFPQTGVDVQVYKNYKSKKAESTLADPSIAYPYYVAVDKAGNVYLTFSDQGGGNDVGEFPAKSTVLTTLFSSTPNFQGIGVGPKGNLLIDDYNDKVIDIYPPGASSPTSTIATANSAQSFALNAMATDIFTADFNSNTIGDYTYPGGKLVQTISDSDEHWGVATSPASPLGTWHP